MLLDVLLLVLDEVAHLVTIVFHVTFLGNLDLCVHFLSILVLALHLLRS